MIVPDQSACFRRKQVKIRNNWHFTTFYFWYFFTNFLLRLHVMQKSFQKKFSKIFQNFFFFSFSFLLLVLNGLLLPCFFHHHFIICYLGSVWPRSDLFHWTPEKKFASKLFLKLLISTRVVNGMLRDLEKIIMTNTFKDNLQTWDRAFAVLLLYLEECSYLHYHVVYGPQTWHVGELSQGVPYHNVHNH